MEKLFGNYHKIKSIIALFIIVFLGSSLSSCSVFEAPPNTRKYKSEQDIIYFMDKSFIKNGDWDMYLIYLKNTFGPKSEKYLSNLPDSTVWNEKYKGGDITKINDLYQDSPVIGVTAKQIKNYCKFRLRLIEEKYHRKYICRLPTIAESKIFYDKNAKICSFNSNGVFKQTTCNSKDNQFYFFCVFEKIK